MFFKNIEQKIKELGFEKVYQSDLVIQFQREDKQFDFIYGVDIVHKQTGKHIIQSYQKNSPCKKFDCMVGITFDECKLFLKYAKKLKW